ncbi:MAG: hypothetical protein KBS75_07600 [Bacteroidales bacterium]|nr:hypothetical protein [Candidatus Equimonas faecalis]
MPIYRFPITGIRHHALKGRLDELYECAPGKRVSISIEHDNPEETDAVIAYWGKKPVGYVRSGEDREKAATLIGQTGRGSLLGRVVDVDRVKRWLWLEVSSEQMLTHTVDVRPNLLTNWTFEGKTLPTDEEEVRLHTMLCNLEMLTEEQVPWDEDMEEWLEYTEQNLWRDISLETSELVKRILTLLTAIDDDAYRTAASRLQLATDCMGSPEVRRLQAQQIIDKAHTQSMDMILLHYAESSKDAIRKLPEELLTLFLKDGEILMGRLWYMRQRHEVIRGVLTLLALNVLLREEAREISYDGISREWMIEWAKRRGDAEADSVVHQLIADFELAQTDAPLLRRLDEMHAACRKGDVVIEQATIDNNNGPISIREQTFVEGMSPGEVQRLIDERDTKLLTKE